jgi:hypothetical protein
MARVYYTRYCARVKGNTRYSGEVYFVAQSEGYLGERKVKDNTLPFSQLFLN